MKKPKWIFESVVLAMHDAQLAEHGGASGVRDDGLLSSALARPENLYAYGETDFFALAAAYAFGLARNHPFVDGNKRTAFLTAYVFLRLNGFVLTASESAVVAVMQAVAAGDLAEKDFASWLRAHAQEK